MHELESREDYLERILILGEKMDKIRSIDIVNDMGFSKPSVSIAMKKLKDAGHIEIDSNGYITLTEEGRKIAVSIYEKHKLLTEILLNLGISEENATHDACLLEHDLSEESFEKIKEAYKKNK